MTNTNNNLPSEQFNKTLLIYANRLRSFMILISISLLIFVLIILSQPDTNNSWGIAGLLLIGVVISIGMGIGVWKRYQIFYDATFERPIVESTLSNFNDQILLRAWRLMFQHDLKAVAARKNFSRTRSSLILITVLSTVVAVWATFVSDELVLYKLLAFIALSLPIVGSTYITYIQRFSKITVWLKHRVVAERIRSEIYQYRMKVGDYKIIGQSPVSKAEIPSEASKAETPTPSEVPKVTISTPSEQLNEMIHTIEKELESEEAYIDVDNKKVDAKIAGRLSEEGNNNTDGRLEFDDYLRIRGTRQKNWYEKNIKKNYSKTKDYTSLALVVQMGGAILTALVLVAGLDSQFIVFATVTNAISFGINSWITVEMTGQVYSIFNVARKQLSKHLGDWDAFNNQLDRDETTITNEQLRIVVAIEATLGEERENWYRLALQTLSSNDQALFQAVEELRQDKFEENGKSENESSINTDKLEESVKTQ